MTNWKSMSRLIAEMHNTHGKSAVTLSGDNAFARAVNEELGFKELDAPHLAMSWKDEELTPKMIRRWMWELRQDKIIKETEDLFAWTIKEDKGSVGGFGTLVTNDEATIPVEVTDA